MEDTYLEDLCKKCTKTQHIEMLKIVVENGMKFSENKNGVLSIIQYYHLNINLF